MGKPFTIRVFVPNGDLEGVWIIDRMHWMGRGIKFQREKWPEIKKRQEVGKTGIYILVGYKEHDDLPTLYIGQSDGIGMRIKAPTKTKSLGETGQASAGAQASDSPCWPQPDPN